MKIDVNDFVTIVPGEYGEHEMNSTLSQEANLYKWLARKGFLIHRLDKSSKFLLRSEDGIKPASIHTMRDLLFDTLKKAELTGLDPELNRNDVLEWMLISNPIKDNKLLRYHLRGKLSKEEIHDYRLRYDVDYHNQHRFNATMSMLEENGFKETPDLIASFSRESTLYYKPVGNGQYLVFSRNIFPKQKYRDNFDCWLAYFRKEKDIGKIKSTPRNLCLTFYIDQDLNKVKLFLN